MLVTEFQKKVVIEWPYWFTTPERVTQFKENCDEELKAHEGDILARAWKHLLRNHKTASHPKMGVILEACSKYVQLGYSQSTKEESHNAQQARQMVKDYKDSETFLWCCEKMIAHDALVYIEQNVKFPEQIELNKYLTATKETRETYDELHNKREFTGYDSLRYNWAKDLIQANQNYYDEYITKG